MSLKLLLLLVSTLLLCITFSGVDAKKPKVYELIYEDYASSNFDYCFRVFNKTHEFGCQSLQSGNVGVLYNIQNAAAVDEFVKDANLHSYSILMEERVFNKKVLNTLIDTKRVQGILIYNSADDTATYKWSPASKCPRVFPALYTDLHGSEYSSCKKGDWNPLGDGLLDISVPFPVFFITENTLKSRLFTCLGKYNDNGNYPYCAVEMTSFMNAAGSSEICLRRGDYLTINPSNFCDKIAGNNVFGSLKTMTSSADETSKVSSPTIMVTSPMDARSFMPYSNTASSAHLATGFITTLAVAKVLSSKLSTTQKDALEKNIIFTILDGEAFDGIGSKRMISDMKTDKFPTKDMKVTLDDIANVVEIHGVGLMEGTSLYARSDPASTKSAEVDSMLATMAGGDVEIKKPSEQRGLPPSTLHNILRSSDVPAFLITDYDLQYSNTHYKSRYDTLKNLGVKYEGNVTEAEMLVLLEPLALELAKVVTTISRGLYKMAAGAAHTDATRLLLEADVVQIQNLLYCFLHKSNCTYFRDFIADQYQTHVDFAENPVLRYTGAGIGTTVKTASIYVHNFLFAALGTEVDSSECVNETLNSGEMYFSKDIINSNHEPNQTGVCIKSSSYLHAALQSEDDEDSSMWSESAWLTADSIKLRIFLVNPQEQVFTLIAGILVTVITLIVTYFAHKHQKILFPAAPQDL